MTAQIEETFPRDMLSAPACAEAAAWIARLHGVERTTEVEQGLRRWLAASAEHRAAFELANDVWMGTERWPQRIAPVHEGWIRGGIVLTVPRTLLAAAAIAALVLVGVLLEWRNPDLVTQIGEQHSTTLEDGTRVSLNTATRVHVDFSKKERLVRLETGEALFEVAKRTHRPFVVAVGDRRVTALGTAFVVRREGDRVAVTLVEGKVAVASEDSAVTTIMTPGERLTFLRANRAELDRPRLEQVVAWERGQVVLDHTPLREAIAEMNRYSLAQIAIDEPTAAHLEVTGVFRSGDAVSFAQAVAANYGLEIVHEDRLIRLTRVPQERRLD